ncbi:leucine-rich repeat domain-containing protein [Pseudomonadota bacterium AL_CKDN230030165-1A_HGKHYDSX7]
MSSITYSVPQPGRDERWGIIHSRQAQAFLSAGEQVVHYDAPPDAATLARIRSAHLWAPYGDALTEVPALIATLPSLVSLSIGPGAIDPALIGRLRADMFPPSLRHLMLTPGQGNHTWKGGPMPRLESLFVDRPLRFEPEDFSGLASLSVVPDNRGAALERALQLPLRELDLLNVPFDETLFGRVATLPLEAFGLVGGRTLKTLDGIEALPQLRALRIKNQNALQSIGALRGLPQLARLDIQYCKHITDVAVLDELADLQRLTLVGCGKLGLGELHARLEARVPQTNIAATT